LRRQGPDPDPYSLLTTFAYYLDRPFQPDERHAETMRRLRATVFDNDLDFYDESPAGEIRLNRAACKVGIILSPAAQKWCTSSAA
jgi:hypothetical protein